MNHLGIASQCVGLDVTRNGDSIMINQEKYIKDVLDRSEIRTECGTSIGCKSETRMGIESITGNGIGNENETGTDNKSGVEIKNRAGIVPILALTVLNTQKVLAVGQECISDLPYVADVTDSQRKAPLKIVREHM
ncbi:hypothetical protein EVAR_80444_1 [Eumeta japonica]|uniref:Retrovirus-related Pol polyprotein from transposon TNT 1-94 n=1 Tax=Eumeta variegata TaxID=151549 RepID=A0A4C1VHV3_EUMVA|nr:hypothetical protein EVAR_80444_1 [Eumeta japonica]